MSAGLWGPDDGSAARRPGYRTNHARWAQRSLLLRRRRRTLHDAPQSHACGGHATCQWELPRALPFGDPWRQLGPLIVPSASAPGRSIIAGAIGSDSVGHGWSRIERTVELSTVADSVHGGSRGRLLHLPMRGVAILDSGACSRVPLPARGLRAGRAGSSSAVVELLRVPSARGRSGNGAARLGPARLADRDDRAREPRERGRSVLPPGGGW